MTRMFSLDLRASKVDAVTLGQYMQPTKRHIKVQLQYIIQILYMYTVYINCLSAARLMQLRSLAGARVRDARQVRRVGARGAGLGLRVRGERAARALLVPRRRVLPRAHAAQKGRRESESDCSRRRLTCEQLTSNFKAIS